MFGMEISNAQFIEQGAVLHFGGFEPSLTYTGNGSLLTKHLYFLPGSKVCDP